MGKSLKILIVEDDYISRNILMHHLSEIGTCDIATNGKEALDIVKISFKHEQKFDLILLDIMMPEMSGLEFLSHLRGLEEEYGVNGLDRVKVLMTTALGDTETVFKAFKEQCDGYLVKPIKKEQVFEFLKNLKLI
ncbi:response regulator [bacterium]|nr:response regulator [bacterium]